MRQAAALAALLLAACPAPRSALRPPTPLPIPLEPGTHHDEPALAGVMHRVGPGETLWRIARAYGIDPGDLMETNGIPDPRALAAGAELFVPGATRVVEVPPAGEGAATSSPTPTPTATSTATSTSTSTATATPASREAVRPEPVEARREPVEPGRAGTNPAPVPAPPSPPARRSESPLAWPLDGVLYGRYGVRAGKRHDGIDIAAPEGTPVRAAAAGTVIYAGEQAGYGAVVILKHDGGLVTLYAHNARLLVDEGERVRRGDRIALVGETGRTSGPHLHFEVREGTRPKNPLLFLP